MKRWIVLLLLLLVAACGADDKKKKKAKKPKVTSPAERAERACEATCERGLRCDEAEVDPCMKACRLQRTRHMHIYRTRFVFAYADCLDKLPCGKDIGRCQAVAVATMMEPPDDPNEEKKSDDKAKKGDEKKKKKKPKKKKKKKDLEAEKKRKKQAAAAVEARKLFGQCHDRRLACDGEYNDRCNAAGALTDGGRERVRECLSLPCNGVRRCLQDAVSW